MITLFLLPIHHHSYEKYYELHNELVKKKREDLEKFCGIPFDQLDKVLQKRYIANWDFPPWFFNDIAGYLDIQLLDYKNLCGFIFLMRKHHPRNSILKQEGKAWYLWGSQTTMNRQFLYYCEIDKIGIDPSNNDSCLTSLEKILNKTKREIKNVNRNFKLWLPPYDFSNFNYVEAIRQIRNKEK